MARASTTDEFSTLGVAGPLQVLDAAQAAQCREELAAYEARLPSGRIEGKWRFQTHLFLPWVAEIIRHPALLAAVQACLGSEDILVWYSEWMIKEPGTPGQFKYHQDSTYAGLDPPEECLTAWVALTDADEENGGVEFILGSHGAQLPHVEVPGDAENMLLKGQRIADDVLQPLLAAEGTTTTTEQRRRLLIPLRPGQATLHAFRCVHASGPNRSAGRRRVGLAVRYVTARVRQVGPVREGAVLVSGRDSGGHFDLRPLPAEAWDAAGLALHGREMAALQANYMDQARK